MFQESKLLNKLLGLGRAVLPRVVFRWAQPIYHWKLAMLGALIYGFPSRAMTVIAVTGTKGKSTTVFMIAKILSDQGIPRAALGSIGFMIKDKTWPNDLKMTLPGRMKLQKFLWRSKKAGVKYVVLEATSEGIVQHRLAGVKIDCAVYTNLHREHLESHGSFENYMAAKQKLFLRTRGIHVLNIDDPYFEKFANFPAQRKITYGKEFGDVNLKFKSQFQTKEVQPQEPQEVDPERSREGSQRASASYGVEPLKLKILGDFNQYNALAALAVAHAYNLDMDKAVASLNSIESVPGRMEIIHAPDGFSRQNFWTDAKGLGAEGMSKNLGGFDVVIDYAHTPDSLELVYQTLRNQLKSKEAQPREPEEVEPLAKPETGNQQLETSNQKLVCVLGAAGGGRDKWKRPEFGKIAAQYCDEIILTNEDPYDENPVAIIEDIERGFSSISNFQFPISNKNNKLPNYQKILDRKEAIKTALSSAKSGDIVIITGKGSETSMALLGGKKIPWSDKEVVEEWLSRQTH